MKRKILLVFLMAIFGATCFMTGLGWQFSSNARNIQKIPQVKAILAGGLVATAEAQSGTTCYVNSNNYSSIESQCENWCINNAGSVYGVCQQGCRISMCKAGINQYCQ